MKQKFMAILCLAAAVRLCTAEPPPDTGEPPADLQFKGAYEALAKGDEARDRGKTADATRWYQEALAAYMKLAQKYPEWQSGVVKFRINYCNNQLEALMKKLDGHTPQPIDTSERVPASTPAVVLTLNDVKTGARQLLIAGETEKARALLAEGLGLDPDDITVRLLTGIAQCQGGEYAGAFDLVRQVIAESPSNACAHVVMGTVHFALGQNKAAEKEIRRALELKPDMKAAHYDLARLLVVANPPDGAQARDHYQTAVKLGAAPDASFELLLKKMAASNAPPAVVKSPAPDKKTPSKPSARAR